MASLSERLAAFGQEWGAAPLPEALRDHAKLAILDTIGLCLAACRGDDTLSVREELAALGPPGKATVIGRAGKLAGHTAAMVNGWLAHVDDYDDTHQKSVTHVSAVVVPAALAAAEEAGVDGTALLRAVVLGSETMIRVGLMAKGSFHATGFHTTGVAGALGATMAAATAMQLDPARTADALGIAGSMASGLLEFLADGATVKRLHAGWAAQSGIAAARLARAGMTGPRAVFEGKHGMLSAFGHGRGNPDLLLGGLGETWHQFDTAAKLYPCCHWVHDVLDLVGDLRERGRIAADDIEQVTCLLPAGAIPVVAEPRDRKLEPQDGYGARFSLPYCTATMIRDGRVDLGSFDRVELSPPLRDLMGRVTCEIDRSVADYPDRMNAKLEIRAKNGDVIRADSTGPAVAGRANSLRPSLLRKFAANCQVSPGRPDPRRLEEVVSALDRGGIDRLADALASAA